MSLLVSPACLRPISADVRPSLREDGLGTVVSRATLQLGQVRKDLAKHRRVGELIEYLCLRLSK